MCFVLFFFTRKGNDESRNGDGRKRKSLIFTSYVNDGNASGSIRVFKSPRKQVNFLKRKHDGSGDGRNGRYPFSSFSVFTSVPRENKTNHNISAD